MRPKFRTRALSSSTLEMMICSPERLRRRVLFTPMCSTVPEEASTARKSPSPKGLSRAMETEASRSASTLCTASASAMPPMPSPASSGSIFTPRLPSAMSSASPQITREAANRITSIELLSSVSGPLERWRRRSMA